MQELLEHPAVQAAVAPFVVGLIVALVLGRFRLGGLAVIAGFTTAVGLVAGLTFSPLTATRKIVLLALLVPLVGIALDFGVKPGRLRSIILAIAAGALVFWVFLPVLSQKPGGEGWLLGGVAVALVAWLVGATDALLAGRSLQNATAALFLGVGAGALAVMGASASLGQYGIAAGSGAGALLLVIMLMNREFPSGSTLALSASLIAGLLVAGTMILAQLQWYAAAIFALTPLAARIPVASHASIWVRAIAQSLVTLIPVTVAVWAAYAGSRGPG